MTDPKEIDIRDFTYILPEEKIASHPLAERDASRLLIYEKGVLKEDRYRNIASHLPENSLLLFNNTKVVEARLLFQKPTGGVIEIFCLEPHEQYAGMITALQQKGKVLWQCLVGGASKWKPGQLLEKKVFAEDREIKLTGRYVEKRGGSFIIELSWSPADLGFAELLHFSGAIPLPPYIKRPPEQGDAERYQTIYAREQGSVAAPTAGLHFTASIFEQLKQRSIQTAQLTLHVGAGTFKPVKTDRIRDHVMHAEWIDVSGETIEKIAKHPTENIIAVGTTSLRTLESLYWMGVRSREAGVGSDELLQLSQWEVYEMSGKNIPVKEALGSLLEWMEERKMKRLIAHTSIIIVPGYRFRIVKGLVTNFHQPRSTLLLLIAAFIGDDWKKVYDYALENQFRFLSYGDGCLLWGTGL